MSDVAADLSAFVHETDFEVLPPEAIAMAKACLLDTLGAGWAGTNATGVPQVRELYVHQGGREDSALWGLSARLPAEDAAFVNGLAASVLEYDTVYSPGIVHSDVVVAPALFAVAEREHRSGKELLSALVAANEVVCRLGLSTTLRSGWFYTSTHGVFGAAAGAAKLLGLDSDGVRRSLGIALGHAGGTRQSHIEQKQTKRMHSAFAAKHGVFSADLARCGTTAPEAVFEGPFGFYSMYDEGDVAVLREGLGQRFHMLETAFKKYPTCQCTHAAIDAAMQLVQAHALRAEDIERVQVDITSYMHGLVGADFQPSTDPMVTAQFSVRYGVASALLRGHVQLGDLTDEAVLQPEVGALARQIELRVDQANADPLIPAQVTVHRRQGDPVQCRVDVVPGTAGNPMSTEARREKFLECMSRGEHPVDAARAGALLARVEALEEVADMAGFFTELGLA